MSNKVPISFKIVVRSCVWIVNGDIFLRLYAKQRFGSFTLNVTQRGTQQLARGLQAVLKDCPRTVWRGDLYLKIGNEVLKQLCEDVPRTVVQNHSVEYFHHAEHKD